MPEVEGGQATTPEEGSFDLDSALAEAVNESETTDESTTEGPNTEVETEEPGAQGEDEGARQGSPDEPPAEDGEKYTVKVRGEEIEVTLDELLNGYSRQADYTRSKQDLAREGEALAAYKQLDQAFQEDPIGTLNSIAQSMGLDKQFGEQESGPELDPDDPVARELADLREWRRGQDAREATRQAAEREAAVDRELETVKVQFNVPDLDTDALLQFAVDNRIPSLEIAYKAMTHGQAQEPPKKVTTKRKLPPVEGGRNRNVGVTKAGNDRPSLDDAWAEAWSEAS